MSRLNGRKGLSAELGAMSRLGGEMKDRATAERHIQQHLSQFDDLLRATEQFADRRESSTAAVYAQAAAKHAQSNHAGVWASHRLERLLARIAGALPEDQRRTAKESNTKTVLHVLTTAYTLGGHTRSVWRWIRQDKDRSHSVVLTNQGGTPVPRHLADAVNESGGQFYFADTTGDLLARAATLRRIASAYDRLVLHIHAHDVVPLIAFCDEQKRPPLIYVNHADHTFWLGVGISDIVVHLRESGLPLSTAYRGIESRRCLLLPVPLSSIERTMSRAEAKRRLGVPEDAVVLFSVARPYKYEPVLGEECFVDSLLSVLQQEQNARLLVVGPDCQGQWKRGREQTGGRVMAYGTRGDVATFYQAADIYLDPFPFASTTSFLEAGMYGSPLVSYSPFGDERSICGADSPELKELIVQARNLETYRSELLKLMRDQSLREELGQRTRNSILDAHVGPKWNESLDEIYSTAAGIALAVICTDKNDSPTMDPVDIRLICISANSGISRETADILREDVGLLPLSQRVKLWTKLPRRQLRVLLRFVLFEWLRHCRRKWMPWKRRALNQEVVVA